MNGDLARKLQCAFIRTYREEAITQLSENPYQLIEEIEGVGFQRADELAKSRHHW